MLLLLFYLFFFLSASYIMTIFREFNSIFWFPFNTHWTYIAHCERQCIHANHFGVCFPKASLANYGR